MGKREACKVLASAVAEYLFEGGHPQALVGADRLHWIELADALEAMGYVAEARVVRES